MRKIKLNICITVSASEGENAHEHTSIICKGRPRRRRKTYEKCHVTRECLYIKKTWVDITAIIEIAKEFSKQDRVKHGDTWKLTNVENLLAHCAA